ncbi:GNAT family N-acetyltransferase [Croceivirga radicis]|uniref:GNAT family N-acetyltransferase n=1 Tax=Croceivirga radicis TaxID=1929488 RepID=A0A1V6LRZ6_9FLAO|nr:GNAT family N-acetyltransferase [Croceivirga radicis]OQD42889.1 GNAT family N-acetyltransferase [Croceivirga radicis]
MIGYTISKDKNLLQFDKIHKTIKTSYWGGYRTEKQTKTTIENTICFGVYNNNMEQVGFARVLTDQVVFAYIMDVIIFDGYQGKGLGKWLVAHILEDDSLKNVLTISLKTKDAHKLYEKYGFKSVGNSELWMAIDKAKLD